MYIPNLYRDTDRERVLEFMRRNSFASLVSTVDGVPVATHLPLSLTETGDRLVLQGHFAKANPQWQAVEQSQCLVIFTGPHAYISPNLYDRDQSVPTWNYLSVHAYGSARLTDGDETVQGLHRLFEQNDAGYRAQWDGLSERYRTGMLAGIVGFEVTVTRIEGAAKLSQNKNAGEQRRIADHLLGSTEQLERETGAAMRDRQSEESG